MKIDLREVGLGALNHIFNKVETELGTDRKLFDELQEPCRKAISEVLHSRNSFEVHDGLAAIFKVGHKIIEHRRKSLESKAIEQVLK